MIPIRCMTCGRPISGSWEKFNEKIKAGEHAGKVMDELGIDRYCCRALFLTQRDVLSEVGQFRV